MDGLRFDSRLEGFQEMSSDPCLKAALDYVRPLNRRPWYVRFWSWYKRATGYETALLQRRTGLRIQSTVPASPKVRLVSKKDDFLKGII
jgi:hypothetical protein